MPVLVQLSYSTCRCLIVLTALATVGSCTTSPPRQPDLVCQVASVKENARGCMSVPTLVDGELQLLADGTFELNGRYDACYQVEDIRISGTYQSVQHASGVDFELLATRTQIPDRDAQDIARTIGLVNLDSQTLQARFTDTAAVIRSRGQLAESPPSVNMTCIRQ